MSTPPQPRLVAATAAAKAAMLNFDVLVDVLSCIDTGPELLPAMRTCRTLYLAGIPLLLRSRVVVRSRAKLISFCRFMLRDGSWRFRHLRNLEISVPGRFKTPAKAGLLVEMFAHARCLERLKIYDCEVLLSDARLPSVLSALAALRHITLHSLNDAASAFLSRLDAGLECVNICFYGDTVEGPGDPVPLLAQFTPYLRELRVTYTEFAQDTVRYVNLTTLVVDDCQFAKVEPLVNCFPNLRDLSLWMGQEDDELDDEEVEEHRQLNGDAQAQARWTGLETLRGSLLSLYMFHLRCTVTHLDVQSAYLTGESAYQLAGILADVSPLILTVRIDVPRFDTRRLGELLRPTNIVGLIIHIDFWDRNVLPMLTMRSVIKSLSGVQAHTLILHPQYVPPLVSDADGDNGLPVSPSSTAPPKFCLEEQAAECLTALATVMLPALRRFVVDTRCCRYTWEVLPGPQACVDASADGLPGSISENGNGCSSAQSLCRIASDVACIKTMAQ